MQGNEELEYRVFLGIFVEVPPEVISVEMTVSSGMHKSVWICAIFNEITSFGPFQVFNHNIIKSFHGIDGNGTIKPPK